MKKRLELCFGNNARWARHLTPAVAISFALLFAPPASSAQMMTASAVGIIAKPGTLPGSISGTVTDADGASIPGARVTISGSMLSGAQTAVADNDGWFSFMGVPPGDFKLVITSPGFQDLQFLGTLKSGQDDTLPALALHIANTSSDVQVTLTPYDVAEIEVKAEETQHVGYVLPNFFITYDWHALPLTTRQKYELAFHSTIDPGGNILNAATAGIYQAFNILPGYHQGTAGYARRFGAISADNDVGIFLGGAVFPSLFHQDPRYFYMGRDRGNIRQRTMHALLSSVICRGDNGRAQFSYSGVLGDLASGAASNLYYPASSRSGAALTVENGLLSVVGDAVSNVMQEFVVRYFTPRAPRPNP